MDLMRKHPKLIIINGIIIFLFGLTIAFPERLQIYNTDNYLGLHILLEMVSITISFTIFILGWKLSLFNRSSSLLLLSIMFLAVGMVDLFHTLSFYGMPHFVSDSSVAKATWLWVIARMISALSILLIFSISDKRINRKTGFALLTGAAMATAAVIWIVFRFEDSLPVLAVEGEGTTILKNQLEYFISFLYLILLYKSYKYYQQNPDFFSENIMLALSIMLLSELQFTLYLSVYDLNNFYGHILKGMAYYFILQAFLKLTIDYEKRKEQEAVAATEELDRVLKMHDGIVFKYFKEGDHFILGFCEGELLKTFGMTSEQLVGKNLEDLSFLDSKEPFYRMAWEENRKMNVELTIMNRCLYISLNPIFNDGDYYMIGTVADITELKKMEVAILNSEKLGMVGQLAAGVAHELRNPLTTLKGFLQLLKPELKEDRQAIIELMQSEVERIELITHEFMAVAKPQAAIFKTEHIAIGLQDVIRFLNPQAILKGVDIHFENSAENCLIHCDPNQIKQVWLNLVKNALEAMPNGGNIHIKVEETGSGLLKVEIKDEGTGMPPEVIEKLGQPFFTSKEGGHGLGIMMVQKIIQSHRGIMHIKSEPGKGTAFTIELPFITTSKKQAI